MSYEAWPSPDAPRGPLPRIDDLPLAEQGYDQEAVREAFDAFYRHAAQLDVSLRALEAVETFRRDAAELRNDLRALRALGYGGLDQGYAPRQLEAPRREIPAAVPRLAAECAFIIAVAVVAGLGHFRPWVIVALLGGALAIVAFVEWLAERSRFAVPPIPESAALPVIEGERVAAAPEPPTDGYGWPVAAESAEVPAPAGVDEMTMAGPPPEDAEEPEEEGEAADAPVAAEEVEVAVEADEAEPDSEPVAEPVAEVEPKPVADLEPEPAPDVEPEPDPVADVEPEPVAARKRWFRRAPAADEEPAVVEPSAEAEPETPGPEPEPEPAAAVDPWEQGAEVNGAPDAEPEPELAGRAPRFRRRRR
jgi:hypothetical protein